MTPPDALLDLPAGWRTIPLELLGEGARGLELVAAHETTDAGFTANITLGVQPCAGPGDVAALGAAALRQLADTESAVVLRRREVLGAEPPASLVQEVAFTTAVEGGTLSLVQTQAFLAEVDPDDTARVRVRTLTCTATTAQAEALADEVGGLVEALRAGHAGR